MTEVLSASSVGDHNHHHEGHVDDDHEGPPAGWWNNAEKRWWHPLAIRYLNMGPMPKHVAFVMDGNRRYARSNALGSVVKGHEHGFTQLTKILEWCSDLGVTEVTVYAFSIENFKRSKDEVDGLMRLAEEKFKLLLKEKDKIDENQIRFRFHGDLSLLSPSLRALFAQIMISTKDYTKGTVNVCMPYTSTDEMARAVDTIRQGVQAGLVRQDQISEWLISKCLDTRHSSNPDLLVRTSGEKRLSDFLMYQMASSHLHYDPVMWPEFGFYELVKAVRAYQCHYKDTQCITERISYNEPSETDKAALTPFLEWAEQKRTDQLKEWAEYKGDS